MRRLRALWKRLCGGWGKREDFDAELASHIEMHVEDAMRRGLTREQARREALLKLGGAEQTRQAVRDRATLPAAETVLQDVRFALRGFYRNPAFTATVVATLALGIGSATAVFSVVDHILFRPLPYTQDDRLVAFGLSQPLELNEFTLGFFFFDWQAHQRPFEMVTYERGASACNLTEQNPAQMLCAQVAANFLPTLGVTPVLGRNFAAEEDQPNGPQAALLTYSVWRNRYGGDASILQRKISIDGRAVQVVGVLPADFEMPRLQPVDLVLPAQVDRAHPRAGNAGLGMPLWAFARLKPGVSVTQARAEMEPLFQQMRTEIPAQFRDEFRLSVRSIRDRQMQEAYRAAWLLLGAMAAILLIACANVASLFSARGAAREHEMAVRTALGASRARLMRQMLTEALLAAAAGGVVGYALAWGLLRAFVAIAPSGMPFLTATRLDVRMLVFTMLLTVACALFCGLLPALGRRRSEALTARATASAGRIRMRRGLVSAQIAVSILLLANAGLLIKSFRNLQSQNLGMRTDDALVVRVPLTQARYSTSAAYMNFFLRAEEALKRIPGVEEVGVSDSVPPDANDWHDGMRYPDLVAVGKPRTPAGIGGSVSVRHVTPGYFPALGVRMVRGRAFTEQERAAGDAEIILSRTLAERMFPGEDPVGRHIQIARYLPQFALDGPVYSVMGVAGDVKNAGLSGDDVPEIYLLRRNRPEDWSDHNVLVVRTPLSAAALAPWIRTQIAAIDPEAPVKIAPLRETVQRLADRPRFEAMLVGVFALCGLLLAAIGLYGVMSYVATQRTREIGVRMALGATRAHILRLIAAEGARIFALGCTVGLIAALAAARLIRTLLFGVQPRDPATFFGAVILLTCVAAVALLVPARAATKTDPMEALRAE